VIRGIPKDGCGCGPPCGNRCDGGVWLGDDAGWAGNDPLASVAPNDCAPEPCDGGGCGTPTRGCDPADVAGANGGCGALCANGAGCGENEGAVGGENDGAVDGENGPVGVDGGTPCGGAGAPCG